METRGESRYLMESPDESSRLEGKTNADRARERVRLVAPREGGRALDAGAGTGAIARVIAEVMGPRSEVVAFDMSADRLAHGEAIAKREGATNVRFVRGDLYAPPFEPESFDFVWSEFVFEYLARPDDALSALGRLVRRGGKLVVGDLDGNCVWHEPCPPDVQQALDRIMIELRGHFDPWVGRKLPGMFHRAGLRPARTHVLPYHLYAGTIPDDEIPNWQGKLATIRPAGVRALGGEEAYDRFADAFMRMLKDPSTFTYSTLVLVEWTRS